MKKITLVLIVSLVLIFSFSCKSSNKNSTPDINEVFVSEWWNNPPADTSDYHYEVGTAKGSTNQISRDWAKANANTNLAQYVSNTIETIIHTYVNDAGEVANEAQNKQALEAFEQISRQRAEATLTGVSYKYQTLSDGTVYVLAALPLGKLGAEIKETVLSAFEKNDASVEANRMMNEAIDKYFK